MRKQDFITNAHAHALHKEMIKERCYHTHIKCVQHSAYHVAQGNEKGEIYQSAQTAEPEPIEVNNTGALHHQLFQEH